MGLGAAVGGFAQGLAGGLKLRSDLDDAETKRKLAGTQQQLAETQLKGEQEKQAAAAFAQSVTDGYYKGDDKLGFVRGEDGNYDPQNPANINRYYDLQRTSAARFAAAYGQDPNAAIARVDEMQNKKYVEGVSRAAAAYGMGDLPTGDEFMRRVSSLSGMTKQFVGSEVDPTNPEMVRIKYRGKDGTEQASAPIKLTDLANKWIPYALDPTASSNRQIQLKQLEQKDTEINDLRIFRNASVRLQGEQVDIDREKLGIAREGQKIEAKKVDGLLTYYDRMGRAALARADSDKSAADLSRLTQSMNNQLGSITTLLGIDKNFDPKMASKEDIEAHNAKLGIANSAMFLVTSGIQNNKLTMDAPKAIRLAQAADNAPFKDIQRAGPGMFFVEFDGVKVPIGLSEAQYKLLEEANAKTNKAATPAAGRRGISVPSGATGAETSFGLGMAP